MYPTGGKVGGRTNLGPTGFEYKLSDSYPAEFIGLRGSKFGNFYTSLPQRRIQHAQHNTYILKHNKLI